MPADAATNRLLRASLLTDCLLSEGLSKAAACQRAAREMEKQVSTVAPK